MVQFSRTLFIFTGVVMEVVDDFYKVECKHSVLPQLFMRDQPVRYGTSSFLHTKDVPENTVSLRDANKKMSLVGGQGFMWCSCSTAFTMTAVFVKNRTNFAILAAITRYLVVTSNVICNT